MATGRPPRETAERARPARVSRVSRAQGVWAALLLRVARMGAKDYPILVAVLAETLLLATAAPGAAARRVQARWLRAPPPVQRRLDRPPNTVGSRAVALMVRLEVQDKAVAVAPA